MRRCQGYENDLDLRFHCHYPTNRYRTIHYTYTFMEYSLSCKTDVYVLISVMLIGWGILYLHDDVLFHVSVPS